MDTGKVEQLEMTENFANKKNSAMADQVIFNEDAAHRKFAVDCFNKTWTLLEKKDRTNDENELMVNMAHASLYHWRQVGTSLNEQRGEWMLARVYTVLRDKMQALHHAERCLAITEKNEFQDFDLAFAYEAMARANALNNNSKTAQKYFDLAKKAAEDITKNEDKEIFVKDLEEEPWFGVK